MRDSSAWKKPLLKEVRASWAAGSPLSPGECFDVELGLYLLQELFATANARCLWVLLTGYALPSEESKLWDDERRRKVGIARHLLHGCHSEYRWDRLLAAYRDLSESVRGFHVAEDLKSFQRKNVAVAFKRWDIFAAVLGEAPAFTTVAFEWAEAGEYYYRDGKERVAVTIPPWVAERFKTPAGHKLEGKARRAEIVVSWDELAETAAWMDKKKGGSSRWLEPFKRVRLELFGNDSSLRVSRELKIQGMVHLAGMVSSGKSTLMDILAVWCVRKGLHVTLVVSDVIGALNKAAQLDGLGLAVAPIIGKTNRARHRKRLHRAVDVAQKEIEPLQRHHAGFRWVSMVNPLLGLSHQGEQPSRAAQLDGWLYAPGDDTQRKYASPLYAQAPVHNGQRDLVSAKLWIATVPSLVCSGVDPQLNREKIRFCEVVYRCSDLVIFDEADQVQARLDDLFNPTETLIERGENGWLNRCAARVVKSLNETGSEQFSRKPAADWYRAQQAAQSAANAIYMRLLQNPELKDWIARGNYFSAWLLLSRLGAKLWADNDHLPEEINRFLDDPLGEKQQGAPGQLVTAASLALLFDVRVAHEQIEQWLVRNTQADVLGDAMQRQQFVAQFELSLLVAVLQDRLNRIIVDWDCGAREFALDNEDSLFFRWPPRDFEPIVPAAPMGNILAFQYLTNDADNPGVLRFFRCMGVGRWLMLRFHELFPADKIVGPNVLLLSGTSWAGTSPACHVQVQPQGVLKARDEEVQAIAESKFVFMPLKDTRADESIRVSGLQEDDRISALRRLVTRLCHKNEATDSSLLENERRSLPAHRQRLLLLVGSYDEAKLCQECLVHERPDWKEQVYRLIRDDDESDLADDTVSKTVPRGMVHTFPEMNGWILVAPLLAVERGHNIVNDEGKAAFGAAYFLVRPHPRPNDATFAIQSISRWAIEQAGRISEGPDLLKAGEQFRHGAFQKWHRLLSLPLRLASLPRDEREAVLWNTLVVIWQVIGRLVRGGAPAHVYFCDAAFGPQTATFDQEQPDTAITSQLLGMRELLRPYFEDAGHCDAREVALVQALYTPLYQAFVRIDGMRAPDTARQRIAQNAIRKEMSHDV